jgi:polysaccharide biosynthesis transport protein
MNVLQFFRILWAYRLIILAFAAIALVGSIAFVQMVSPRYEAQARVMLDIVKPDPVTGQVISSPFVRAYSKTQIELVKDYQVAGRVVDNLGWATNPGVQAWYKNQRKDSATDFRQWAAREIVENTKARLIEGSNILEITYASTSPRRAAEVSEALRKAYVDLALQSRQEAAKRNAEWYETQAEKAKGLLLSSEEAKANFERQTGIVLQDGQVDLESARLAALASQGATPILTPAGQAGSPSESQLTQLEGELAQASKNLGPNHPVLQEMRRRRELLTAQVARERNAGGAQAAAAASAARASSGALEAQKAKVMAQREQVERLRLMQADVNLRRDQYNQAATRAAQLRQEAEVAVTGVTPLGAAVTPQTPVFPQKGLIVGVAVPVGAILGLLLGLLMELIGRRVRGPEDVALAVNAPVLGVIQSERVKARRGWRDFLPARPSMPAMRPQSAKS